MVVNTDSQFSRLPECVSPKNYNLWLKPCLESFTFRGKVDITLHIEDYISEIIVNCAEIKINSATYCQNDMKILESNAVTYEEVHERATVKFEDRLAKGEGVLSILFEGTLNDKMKGFYRNRHVLNGEVRFGAVTQFEATDARRCFPCFDEPALKATFDVTLVVPKDMVALSNTNVLFEGEYFEDSRFKLLKYATTPVMSTYLLAVVIGHFDFVASSTSKGVPVRVYTPKGKSEQGQFALDVAVKALEYYERYFDIPYPLPKVDLVAIADFSIGAMENWGLITYRETSLLVDEKNSSAVSRQYVSLVVCHELAHMWFGNLVTMEWWTHLWLKEGFANFMEHLSTEHCHPEFLIWTRFATHDYKRALDLDALDNSHPIEVPVKHPGEIDEIFDAISYCKGASVIRMLHHWIGDENFRKGSHEYLSNHSYKNASTEDLWDALGNATGKPVREVMSTWTRQMGFPVIKVAVKSRLGDAVTLNLTQQKFCARQGSSSPKQIWSVPLFFVASQSPTEPMSQVVMTEESMDITLNGVPEGNWIKVNPKGVGFYRIQYEQDLLKPLVGAVMDNTLTELDRLDLISDLFALMSSGISPPSHFLDSLTAYKNETTYAVWMDLDSSIEKLSILLWDHKDIFDKFKSIVLTIYDNVWKHLGWDAKPDESHLDSMLRSIVIRRMGVFGNTSVIDEARKRLADHLSGKQDIPADLRTAVYATVITHSIGVELEKLLELHARVDLHEERVRIERSLGCVTDPENIQKVFKFAMSDKVRSNDKVFVIGSVGSSSCSGREAAWNYVKSSWDELYKMYKGSFFVARLVKLTTENFTTEEKALEVQNFFSKHSTSTAERTVQQSIESIRKKAEWWKRDGDEITKWILNH